MSESKPLTLAEALETGRLQEFITQREAEGIHGQDDASIWPLSRVVETSCLPSGLIEDRRRWLAPPSAATNAAIFLDGCAHQL